MTTNKTGRMTGTKNDRVYVRLNADIKEDFEKVATFRGLTASAMLHSFIVRTIHETKLEHPDLFVEGQSEIAGTGKGNRLSEKLIAQRVKKSSKKNDVFTTSDGKSIPLVEENVSEE